MTMSRKAGYRDTPVVPYLWIDLHAGLKHGHLLDRSHHAYAAPIPLTHELFVRTAPAGHTRRSPFRKLVGKADKFIGQHAAADQSLVAVVEVADGNSCARSQIIVYVEIKQPRSARISVTLKISPHPVVAIAEAVGE